MLTALSTENIALVDRPVRLNAGRGGIERLERESEAIIQKSKKEPVQLIPEGTEINPRAPPTPRRRGRRKKEEVCFLALLLASSKESFSGCSSAGNSA